MSMGLRLSLFKYNGSKKVGLVLQLFQRQKTNFQKYYNGKIQCIFQVQNNLFDTSNYLKKINLKCF